VLYWKRSISKSIDELGTYG